MDYYPTNDQAENTSPTEAYDLPDLENTLSEAKEAQPAAAPEAAQPAAEQPNAPEAQPQQPAPELPKSPEPPPEHNPATAYGEKGAADIIETGAEKPEVEIFHPSSPERGW